jgi:pheromone shutdown-related protein TraB
MQASPLVSEGTETAATHGTPGHIRRFHWEGRDVVLVGTAHVSKASVAEVRRIIEEEAPDTVCVELDEVRHRALTDPTYWQKLDIFQVIRDKKVGFLLANTALASVQRRIGRKLGVKPGDELLEAVRVAKERGANVILADRDIQTTFKRTWRLLSLWDKSQVMSMLVLAPFMAIERELGEKEIEELKGSDAMSDALSVFAQEMPKVRAPLIDERDRYMISLVREAPGTKVVAVVGAAHVPGMVANLETPVDRAALNVVPEPSPVWGILNWLLPLAIVALFVWGAFNSNWELLGNMALAWAIPTGGLAALGTLLAGGKPLTVLAAALAAPVTALHPVLHISMATGLCEAWLRRPTVEDCERITDDIQSLRGVYKNRFTRVLLVVVLSTIGTGIGFWTGSVWLVKLVT